MSKMSFLYKGTVIATLVALAFGSIGLTNAFAKGRTVKAAATTATSSQVNATFIQNSWKDELTWLKIDNAVLGRIDRVRGSISKRLDKDLNNKRADDRFASRLDVTLKDIQYLLGKAQALATAHAGFDANGNVTDQAQALKSMQQLGAILSQLRGTLIYRLIHLV